MSHTRHSVACVAGMGVGPEVMAEASRAISAASRYHGFTVDEHHVAFGSDALMRFGHPFPLSSRRAVLEAGAVLVAPGGESVEGLEAELDLRASVTRVRFDRQWELTLLAPLRDEAWAWTLERAFEVACASRASVALMGVDERWAHDASAAEDRHDAVEVERLTASEVVRSLVLAPHGFDVVVCPPELAATAADLAACNARRRVSAWGRLAGDGPSVFGAAVEHAPDEAGYGVVDPRSMLLAAALLLGEGLGERSAAATLASAVGRARPVRRPSTRGLADVVLAELPLGLGVEFQREAV
jgi:isocitrate/isopropylmalate dehydrogenase